MYVSNDSLDTYITQMHVFVPRGTVTWTQYRTQYRAARDWELRRGSNKHQKDSDAGDLTATGPCGTHKRHDNTYFVTHTFADVHVCDTVVCGHGNKIWWVRDLVVAGPCVMYNGHGT